MAVSRYRIASAGRSDRAAGARPVGHRPVSDQFDDGRGSVIQEYAEQVDAAVTICKDLKCVFDKVLSLWQQAISHVQALGTGSAVAYSAPAPTFLVSCVPKPS